MVAVAAHHVGHVGIDPFLKEVVCAVERRCAHVPAFNPFALGKLPLIGGFVHYEQSEAVAKVVEGRSLGIVAHTDSVDAHSLEVFEAAFPYLVGNNGAEHAGIVV